MIEHDNMFVFVPAKHIPTVQQWYYTEAWQRMMQEAFEDLKRGAVAVPFENGVDCSQTCVHENHSD